MSTFIKSIGNVRFNGLGADLYENKDSSATIRFDKATRDLPTSTRVKFQTLADANKYIERKEGSDNLNTLINILDDNGIS